MNSITKLLDELSELEAKATKGPWVIDEDIWAIQIEGGGKNHYPVTWASNSNNHKNDAKFLCTSRNALPKLIEAMRATTGALSKISEYCESDAVGVKARQALAKVGEILTCDKDVQT